MTATAPRALADAVVRLLRILATTIFRDPVRENRLRFDGLGAVERQAARFGLVLLAAGLGSVLSSRLWRAGPMNAVEDSDGLLFVPTGIVSVTFVALAVAWTLITWGALAGPPLLRVVTAVVFVTLDAGFASGVPDAGLFDSTWPNRLVVAGFWAVPVLLLAAAALSRFGRLWSVGLPVLRALVLAAVLAHFGGYVWLIASDTQLGRSLYEVQMAVAMGQTDGLLMPLVFVSGIVVVDFGLSVALGVVEGVGELPARLLRVLLVAVVAVKLWVEAVQPRRDLWVYVRDRPDAVIRTVAMVLLLVVVVALVTRFAPTDGLDRAKEAILYGSGTAISLAILGLTLVYGVGTLQTVLQGAADLPGWASAYPALEISRYANLVLAALALLAGIRLVRSGWPPFHRELGSGLVVLGAWTLPTFAMQLGDYRVGFSVVLADVLVTVGIAAFAAARWSSLRPREAVTLLAVTVFAWLTLSQGDWLAGLGALLGLSAIVVVVVGIALTVFTDAGFTTVSGRRIPQSSRVLLFVGYLVLSVTLLNWSESVHTVSVSQTVGSAPFLLVGIPWAAWLAGRQLVRRPPTSTTPSTTRTSYAGTPT